jgi:hypothetical protein
MGVRVNSESIVAQLNHRRLEREINLPFNQAVICNQLSFSLGGGIGISRLLMLLLRTAHIGEVQCGVWHDEHYRMVSGAGIDLIPDRIIDLDSSNNEHVSKHTILFAHNRHSSKLERRRKTNTHNSPSKKHWTQWIHYC